MFSAADCSLLSAVEAFRESSGIFTSSVFAAPLSVSPDAPPHPQVITSTRHNIAAVFFHIVPLSLPNRIKSQLPRPFLPNSKTAVERH
jgi:hypothetical protein